MAGLALSPGPTTQPGPGPAGPGQPPGNSRPLFALTPEGQIYLTLPSGPPAAQAQEFDFRDLDLRLARNLTFQRATLQLPADVFNTFNAGAILQRNRGLGSGVFDTVPDIIIPRVARVAVPLRFPVQQSDVENAPTFRLVDPSAVDDVM